MQARLVRAVGRAELPTVGQVFLKVMNFPRAKDQLRYSLRALPAMHEARMLQVLQQANIPCPEVLWAGSQRRTLLPSLSMLVTQALDLADTDADADADTDASVSVPEMVAMAQALIAAGVYHPDLNRGNFLQLRDGRVAVLDLQSARLGSKGLTDGRRLQMLMRLLGDQPESERQAIMAAMLQQGLLQAAEEAQVWQALGQLQRQQLIGRIRRCMQESTIFTVQWSGHGVSYQRRNMDAKPEVVEGGGEMLRYWIGDRALEVLDGHAPILAACHRPWPLLPGKNQLSMNQQTAQSLNQASAELLAGYQRYQQLLQTK